MHAGPGTTRGDRSGRIARLVHSRSLVVLVAGVTGLVGFAGAALAAPPSVNISGTWNCCGSGGAGAQQWTISEDAAGSLSGSASNSGAVFASISGTVSENNVTVVTTYSSPAGYVATFTGTVTGSNTMSGSWSSNAQQSGTWTATLTSGTITTFSSAQPVITPGSVGAQSSTAAALSGTVNPEGLSTTASFQYGLDPSYAGGGPVTYTNQVTASPNPVGSDTSTHTVSASVTGLDPNALYHVRLVASNSAGTTFGPDQTLRTPTGPSPPNPVLGKSFNMTTTSGIMYVKFPGSSAGGSLSSTGPGFIPCLVTCHLPAGTQIDSRFGQFTMKNASGKKGKFSTGTFGGGIFNVNQARSGGNRGLVTLKLLYGLFPGAPTFASCTAKAAAVHAPLARVAVSGSVLSTLRSRSHGRYSTSGHYGSATSRGTAWTITDRCKSTLITVQQDTVVVRNFVHHKTITLRAGQRLLIKARR